MGRWAADNRAFCAALYRAAARVRLISVGNKQDEPGSGWQRQAKSSKLGDGGGAVRQTIAKAYRP